MKIRPGFTPQEDVQRFRGSRQAQNDTNALPKGHILGWAAPSDTIQVKVAQSQSARKNAKRKEKRKEKKDDELKKKIAENWDDSDDDETPAPAKKGGKAEAAEAAEAKADKDGANAQTEKDSEALAQQLEKLEVS